MQKKFPKTVLIVIALLVVGILGATIFYLSVKRAIQPVPPQDPEALMILTDKSSDSVVVRESKNKRWFEQVFLEPVVSVAEVDEHKKVYQNIQAHVPFVVLFPSAIPEGFYLFKASTQPVSINSNMSDSYTVIYYNPESQDRVYIVGNREQDSEFVPEGEEVVLSETKKGIFTEGYETTILYVYDTQENLEMSRGYYYITSQTADKETLADIARSLQQL